MLKKLIIETFNSTVTWTAPDGVGALESVAGRGENGYPETSDYIAQYDVQTTTHVIDQEGNETVIDNGTTSGAGATPQSYCTPPQPFGQGAFAFTCYDYTDTSYTEYYPGYDGQDTTAFGLTFPGGQQQNAQSSGYSNVGVVAGQPYQINVAQGGFVNITYWK